jgi:hypothetical protein
MGLHYTRLMPQVGLMMFYFVRGNLSFCECTRGRLAPENYLMSDGYGSDTGGPSSDSASHQHLEGTRDQLSKTGSVSVPGSRLRGRLSGKCDAEAAAQPFNMDKGWRKLIKRFTPSGHFPQRN